MTKLMQGKRGLIMGVANDHSIAWGIARALHDAGAEVGFSSIESLIASPGAPPPGSSVVGGSTVTTSSAVTSSGSGSVSGSPPGAADVEAGEAGVGGGVADPVVAGFGGAGGT